MADFVMEARHVYKTYGSKNAKKAKQADTDIYVGAK